MEITFEMPEGVWNVVKFFIIEFLVSVVVAESYSWFISALANDFVRSGKTVQVSTSWFVRLSPINTFVWDRSSTKRRNRWPMTTAIGLGSFCILSVVIALEFGSSSGERSSGGFVQQQAHTGSLSTVDEAVDSSHEYYLSESIILWLPSPYREFDEIVDRAYLSHCFSFDVEYIPQTQSDDPTKASLELWPFTEEGTCLRNVTESSSVLQVGFNLNLSDLETITKIMITAQVGSANSKDKDDPVDPWNTTASVIASMGKFTIEKIWPVLDTGEYTVHSSLGTNGLNNLKCLVPGERLNDWYCMLDVENEEKALLFHAQVRYAALSARFQRCSSLGYRPGCQCWISVLKLLGLLGAFFRSVGILPMFSSVQYIEPVRYCTSRDASFPVICVLLYHV